MIYGLIMVYSFFQVVYIFSTRPYDDGCAHLTFDAYRDSVEPNAWRLQV